MSKIKSLAVTFAWLLGMQPAIAGELQTGETVVVARVLKVIDGDTIKVSAEIWPMQTVTVLVRLNGIDTPEIHAHCMSERTAAAAARDNLTRLIGDEPVLLRGPVPDKYGNRVRAVVINSQGADLAKAQISDGVARAYQGGKRNSWC